MKCRQCNTELAEGSTFCGACGATQVPAAPAAAPASPAATTVRSAQSLLDKALAFCKKNKRLVLIAAAALAVVIVLLIVLGGGNSPESVTEDWVEALVEGDYEAFEDTYHPAHVERVGDMEWEFDFLRSYRDVEDYEIEIKKTFVASLDDLFDVQVDYADYYRLEVTEMCEVGFRLTGEKDGKAFEKEDYVTLVEIDGDWYVK